MKVYFKGGKADHYYVFNRLNWELARIHNPVLPNYKTELENTLVTSDPLWDTVVTTEEESGMLLLKKSHLQSQVLSMRPAASVSYCIFLQPAMVMTALQRLLNHFQTLVS